jgi:hypothetical protein
MPSGCRSGLCGLTQSIGAGRIVLSDEESESQWQRNDYKETKENQLLIFCAFSKKTKLFYPNG